MNEGFRKRFQESVQSFQNKDNESGRWFNRIGRPVLVVYFANYTFYYIVTHITTVPGSLVGYISFGYLISQAILGIVLLAIIAKVYKKGNIDRTEESYYDEYSRN